MSFSAEPNRRRAYGSDLRWRIVFQRFGMGLRYDNIARNLNVATSTAYRICARFEATGEVQPSSRDKHRPYLRSLDQQSQLYVVGLIIENPSQRFVSAFTKCLHCTLHPQLYAGC